MIMIDEVLDRFIEDYDRARNGIYQCLSSYELRCEEIIYKISKNSSMEQCKVLFDELQNMQQQLAKLLFVRELDLGHRLNSLTRAFDRLDDNETRKYWFEQFQRGANWPSN